MNGAKLRERRKVLGLTQQALGDILGVAQNSVARWEREEVAIPTFLHLALNWIEWEAEKRASKSGPKRKTT
jgi:transcriptional regulator with XRE-family HTH domain